MSPSDNHDPCEELHRRIRELEEQSLFWQRTSQGLESEISEMMETINQNRIAHSELVKAHESLRKDYERLQKTAAKESQSLETRLKETQQKLKQLPITKFFSARKPYHDLKSAQRAVVNRQIRETFQPEIDHCLKKRKLALGQVVLEHSEGENPSIRINAHSPHTYEQLTKAEMDKVALISDAKSIHQTSHSSYAAMRRIIPELPPFTHIKSYDDSIIASLPPLLDAPEKPGAFFSLRHEIRSQIEFLYKKGGLNTEEPVYVKAGIDATKLTSATSVCVYSIETISDETEIGLVGAVLGGDSYEDMQLTSQPFITQLKDIAKDPNIETDIGIIQVTLRLGGDLCNVLELLGLCKASSRNPCPLCVIGKDQFASAATNPCVVAACNDARLGRNRANIMNEAIQSKPRFGVKRLPITPLPLQPDTLIATLILICLLHARMRLSGKYWGFFLLVYSTFRAKTT